MFERFTDRARKVMALANQEALRFTHEYINTEHILLALIKEGTGVGVATLRACHIDLRAVEQETESRIRPGPDVHIVGRVPPGNDTKKAIEYAIQEARALDHHYLGTEHLLLGLLRETNGIAGAVLTKHGLDLATAQREILKLTAKPSSDESRLFGAAIKSKASGDWSTMACIANFAFYEARSAGLDTPRPGHLLLAVLGSEDPVVMKALGKFGINSVDLSAELRRGLSEGA